MYNRYIRNDNGVYARVQQQEPAMPSPTAYEPQVTEMPPPVSQPAHNLPEQPIFLPVLCGVYRVSLECHSYFLSQ